MHCLTVAVTGPLGSQVLLVIAEDWTALEHGKLQKEKGERVTDCSGTWIFLWTLIVAKDWYRKRFRKGRFTDLRHSHR